MYEVGPVEIGGNGRGDNCPVPHIWAKLESKHVLLRWLEVQILPWKQPVQNLHFQPSMR